MADTTAQRYAKLKAEITVDELGRGYSGMTAAQAATDMNLPYRTRTVPVIPAATLARWAAREGRRARIEIACEDANSPVRSQALSLRDRLQGVNPQPLDVLHADDLGMLLDLVIANVLTDADLTALLATTRFPLQRSVEVWGQEAGELDIAAVRNA